MSKTDYIIYGSIIAVVVAAPLILLKFVMKDPDPENTKAINSLNKEINKSKTANDTDDDDALKKDLNDFGLILNTIKNHKNYNKDNIDHKKFLIDIINEKKKQNITNEEAKKKISNYFDYNIEGGKNKKKTKTKTSNKNKKKAKTSNKNKKKAKISK